jgi:hypothetical protein
MQNYLKIIVIIIMMSCSPENRVVRETSGTYHISGFNSHVELELRDDGTFTHQADLWSCVGGGDIRRIHGTYLIQDNALTLTPESLVNVTYYRRGKRDLKKDSARYYSSDSTYLKKEYQIFRWDQSIYLLSEEHYTGSGFETHENDYEIFSNYYNSGYEPGTSGSYFVKNSNGSEHSRKLDIEKLPAKYRGRFLEQPIVAEIVEVTKTKIAGDSGQPHIVNSYKINRGKRDGVMEKMDFYGSDGCCIIRIARTEETSSYGHIYLCYDYQADCGKRDRVTTWLEREKGAFAKVGE